MSEDASLKRNFSFNALISLLNIVYPVVTLAYVSRIVGPDLLGKYFMAMSMATYFLLVAGMGMPLYGARTLARERGNPGRLSKIFSELFLLNAISSCLCFFVFMGLVFAVPRLQEQVSLYSIVGLIIISNVLSVDYLFVGVEDFRNIAIRNFVTRFGGLAFMFIFVKAPGDFMAFAGIAVVTTLCANAMGLVGAVRLVRIKFRGLEIRTHFRSLGVFFAILVVTAAYTNLDSVILGFLDGEREVGYYNAGLRISRIMVAIVTSAGIVLVPRLTHYLNEGKQGEFAALSKKSMDLICFMGFPFMMFLLVCADDIIGIAYGSGFSEASTALRITAPLILAIGFTNCIGLQILFPNGQEKILLLSATAAAVMGLGLNFLLIPRFGAEGAAIAALAAETTLLFFQGGLAWKRFSLATLFDRRTASYFNASWMAALFCFLVAAGIHASAIRIALFSVVGSVCYFGCLLAMKDPLAREMLYLGMNFGKWRR